MPAVTDGSPDGTTPAPADAGTGTATVAPMTVTVGKTDITPPLGVAMAGYAGDAPRIAASVDRPLFARCTILWDNGIPHAIVTADVLAFPRAMHQSIRTRVGALGIDSPRFVLTATHTHNGPVLNTDITAYTLYNIDNPSPVFAAAFIYSSWLEDQIVALVESTLADPRMACALDYQVINQTFSRNREGFPVVEQDVPILVARDPSGAPLAVLFGYGCHPVAGPGETSIDPDYPGLAVEIIEKDTGPFAQFLTGAAGDQNPTNASSWGARDSDGTSLGTAVLAALASRGRPITGPITTDYRELDIPLDITDTPGNLAVARSFFVQRQKTAAGWISRHAELMIGQIDDHSFGASTPVPVQTWKLSGGTSLRMVFTGGEPVSGYAEHFRSKFGGTEGIWFSGYAGEIHSYLPTDDLLQSGGIRYAAGWFDDFPGLGGGAMCSYGVIAHYRRNDQGDGVEDTLISALEGML